MDSEQRVGGRAVRHMALGLLLAAMVASFAADALAQASSVQTTAVSEVVVGAVAPTPDATWLFTDPQNVNFAFVEGKLAEQPMKVTVPLHNIVADHAFTLTGVTASTDPDLSSVAFVGRSTNAAPILGGAETEVLVLLDWQSHDTDFKPSIVVSVRTGSRTLGQVLGLDPGTVASDISVEALALTVGSSAIVFDDETEDFEHIAWDFNLTEAATAFFEPLYTVDGLPRVVPALRDLGSQLHVTATFPLDVLGDVAAEVLNLPDGAGIVVEGGLGIDISGSAAFDASSVGWSLEGLLPRISSEGLEFPYFLDLESSGRFNLKIAYGEVADSTEDPKPKAVTVTAGADMTTDLFGATRSFFVQLQVKKTGGDESSTSVSLNVSIDQLWDKPFGISFLSVNDVYIDGSFTRSQSSDEDDEGDGGGDDEDGEGEVSFEGSILGYAEVAGKTFSAKLSGKVESEEINAEFELSLTDQINVGTLLEGIGAVFDIPLPNSVSGVALGPAAVHVGVIRPRSGGDGSTSSSTASTTTATTTPGSRTTTITVVASGQLTLDLPAGISVGAQALFSLDKDRKVVAALRSADELSLSGILQGLGIEMPTFGSGEKLDVTLDDASGSAFGMIFSTADTSTTLNKLPKFARVFYRPLLGRALDDPLDAELIFSRGVNVLGSFELPRQVADIVDTVGAQSRVFASGTLPVFSLSDPVKLALGLRLKTKELPDFVDQIQGSVTLDVEAGAGRQVVRLGLDGNLRLRLPAGLPEVVADPLRSGGIPVETFEPVAPDHPCQNGSSPLQSRDSTQYRCYDLVALKLNAGFIFQAEGVGLDIRAGLDTPRPDDVYHPFGFEWLAVDRAELHLGQLVTPDGRLKQILGFLGDVEIGGKDLLVAFEVAVTEMAAPPWIGFEFKGLRIASGAGLAMSDLFDLHVRVASMWATMTGLPEPPNLRDIVPIPNLAVRNLELTLSPKGVPELCIPQGLVVSGDLYVNPSGEEPTGDPRCQDNTSVIPDPDDRCLNHRFHGCVGSGRMKLSYFGLVGLTEITGFDLGPIHWDDLEFDLAFTYTDQHLVGSGGARLDNFTGIGPDPFMSGEFKIAIEPFSMTIFGNVRALTFNALVDVTTDLAVFNNPTHQFELHVLLGTDESDLIGDPSLESFTNTALDVLFAPVRTVAVVADAVLRSVEDNPVRALRALPWRLEQIGAPVPGFLEEFDSEADEFLDAFEDIIDYAPGQTWDLILNGIPKFGFDGVEGPSFSVCVLWTPFNGCEHEETFCVGVGEVIGDDCWIVPPFKFPGTPGICDAVFPSSAFPGLRNSDGDCTRSGIINAIVFPVFEDVLADVLGFDDLNLRRLLSKLIDAVDEPLMGVQCAEYFLKVGSSEAFSQLTFVGELFGQGLGLRLGFDFFDPVNSVPTLFEDLVRQFLNPRSVSCVGYNDAAFGDGSSTEPRLSIQVPPVADEGAPVTLVASFGQVLTAERTVKVRWGDGNWDTIVVPAGEDGFEVTHVHLDDDPTATVADVKQIVVTDMTPGGRTAARTILLRNVAPQPAELELTSESIVEGGFTTFRLTFTDPGVDDTHELLVDWGDGRRRRINLNFGPSGRRTVGLAHSYRDDDPTDTPSDTYEISVTVLDDDAGSGTAVFPVIVHNQAPGDVQLSVADRNGDGVVEENEPVQVRVDWADPGVHDSHTVNVDWGTGEDPVEVRPARGARHVVLNHSFGDNGTFDVRAVVTDDDAQSGSGSLAVPVPNVSPIVGIDRASTFAAPGGDTFMVRQGMALDVRANAHDPGSDDLTFTWSWGDEGVDVDKDRVNPPADDPLPSATRQPRDVINGQSHTYAAPCLYRLELGTDDDDAGGSGDGAPVVVVGVATRWEPFGWWSEEYRHYGSSNVGQVDDHTLLCHLAVAAHMSSVFGEALALDTPEQAFAVLLPQGAPGGQRGLRLRELDQALLAAWLNLAHGATGTDPSGFIVGAFAEEMYKAEAVRLDPQSTTAELFAAKQAVETAVRQHSQA